MAQALAPTVYTICSLVVFGAENLDTALVGALLTLVVNAAYNLPCTALAWAYFNCFELQVGQAIGPDARGPGSPHRVAPCHWVHTRLRHGAPHNIA